MPITAFARASVIAGMIACVLASTGCSTTTADTAPRQKTLDPTPYAGLHANEKAIAESILNDTWRPEWWISSPVRDARGVSVAAFGTDHDLLASLKKAMDTGNQKLRETLGVVSAEPSSRVDTVRLADGQFRTFVLLTAPASGG